MMKWIGTLALLIQLMIGMAEVGAKDLNKSEPPDSALLDRMLEMDSLLFEVAFNLCDSAMGRELVSKDFEFYHDQSGSLLDSGVILASSKMVEDLSKLCKSAHRRLIKPSTEVYPLYNNKVLYGAIQIGEHTFEAITDGQPTNQPHTIARFTHLWILEDQDWKLRRVLSYDHRPFDQGTIHDD